MHCRVFLPMRCGISKMVLLQPTEMWRCAELPSHVKNCNLIGSLKWNKNGGKCIFTELDYEPKCKTDHFSQTFYLLACLGLVTRSYIGHWIRSLRFNCLLFAWSVPSHHLNQCWFIVNWTIGNTLKWNLNQNTMIAILKMSSAKSRPFSLVINVPKCEKY